MGFYEEKDMTRYTMILPKCHKNKIEELAKLHKISQGEVIETMLDCLDQNSLASAFDEKRALKVAKRQEGSELRKKLLSKISGLDSGQIEKLLANI